MKKLIKIISAALAIAMLALLCCSCKKEEDKGTLLATYKGGELYSNDTDMVQWSQYLYNYYYSYIEDGTISSEDVGKIAVNTVVIMRVMEIDLKARGITIPDEEVQESFEYTKASFDSSYNGGYSQLVEDSGLGDDFWYAFSRNAVAESYIQDDLEVNAEFTDDDLTKYYNNNLSAYIKAKGYEYTAVFVEVKDLSDENEWDTQKKAAQEYIDRIRAGESFETVMAEILAKYTEADGYTQAATWSGAGSVSVDNLYDVSDLDAALNSADEEFSDRDQNADKSSDAYASYLKYLIKCMGYSQSYALTHMSKGETYAVPIISPLGWMILRMDKYNEKTYYPTLEEIRYELTMDYLNSLIEDGSLMDVYREELIEKYYVTVEDFTVS